MKFVKKLKKAFKNVSFCTNQSITMVNGEIVEKNGKIFKGDCNKTTINGITVTGDNVVISGNNVFLGNNKPTTKVNDKGYLECIKSFGKHKVGDIGAFIGESELISSHINVWIDKDCSLSGTNNIGNNVEIRKSEIHNSTVKNNTVVKFSKIKDSIIKNNCDVVHSNIISSSVLNNCDIENSTIETTKVKNNCDIVDSKTKNITVKNNSDVIGEVREKKL